MLCSCQLSDRGILPAANTHTRIIKCAVLSDCHTTTIPMPPPPCSELPAPLSTIGPLDRGSLQGTRRDVPQQSSNPQLRSPDFIIPALHSTTSCCPVLVFQNNSPPSVLKPAGTIALETHHKTRLLLMPESPGSASMPPFPAVISCSQSICRQATSTALSPCSAGSSRLGGATCHFGGCLAGCRCSQRPHVAVGLSESCSRFILRSCISHCSLSAVSPRPPMLTREDSSAATLHASDDHAQCSTQR